MMMYVLVVCLVTCMFCGVCVLGIHRQSQYERDNVVVGVLCSEGNITLGVCRSVLQCMGKCEEHAACVSVFYDHTTKQCIGAATTKSTTTGCTAKPGMVYYKAAFSSSNAYGMTCTSDVDCPGTYLECSGGVCDCVAGSPYDPSSGRCLSECTTYGSTFREYLDMALMSQYITLISGISQTQCGQQCTDTAECIAFNYCPSCVMCRLHRLSPLTNPADYVPYSSVNHYTRNCA